MNRSKQTITVLRRGEEHADDLRGTTPAERLAMVWPLTKAAWAFKEAGPTHDPDAPRAESRLQRHVVRFHRRER